VIDWQGLRDTTGVSILLKAGLQYGMSESKCLETTNIDALSLEEPLASIASWQELTLIRNIQRFRRLDEELGLMVAKYYKASELGILGQAMAACATLNEALQLTERYRWLGLSFSRYELSSTDRELRIDLNDRAVPQDCQRFCQERGLAACLVLFSSLLQHSVPVRSVSMRLPEPRKPADYHDFFGTEVSFNSSSNRICFDAELQFQPLPLANRKIRLASERYCEEVLATHVRSQSFVGRTLQLLEQYDFALNVEQIAQHLGLSSRQLRRNLSKEGTSFRELQLSSKMERAQSLLRLGYSIEDIAIQSGYTETASFSRAFKSRLGVSPTRFN